MRDPIRIGQYEVHEVIASGGMASVHFGRFGGPAGFARTVAIKRMHPHLCNDPEFVAMFVDEAHLAARIRHPNVVPTLDVLATSAELLIVMDYVHGEQLAQLIRRVVERKGRIPPAVASAVLCDLLTGLHAAHETNGDGGESLGIIHRDVSPENVLVGLDGSSRVVDFGVAKAIGRLQVTREGQVKGKIAYMAPEQVRGGSLDRRADIYAASVVLWELLVGRRLFGPVRDGELIERILFGTIDAPATIAPHVPEALNGVVLQGLARDPADRFPTARDMARAVRDAVRPASASELSDWVEATAADTLAARASTLRAIDRDHGGGDGSGRSRVGRSPAPLTPPDTDRLAVVLHTGADGTMLPSASRPPLDRGARLRWAGMVLAAVAAVAAVVAVGAVGALEAKTNDATSSHPIRVPSAAPADDQIAGPGVIRERSTASSTAPDRAVVIAGEGANPLASPAPTSTHLGPSSPSSRRRAGVPPGPPSPAPGRAFCDPPYTTDADGTRIYKMHCL